MDIPARIGDLDALEALYREPSALAAGKVRDALDPMAARFVETCTFAVLSTTDGEGRIDASPRGGPPGFVRALDDRHVALADLSGNNRLDSLRNIVVHPYAGLLLFVPGKDDTMRINGPAALTVDDAILDGFTSELRRPKLAIVIETGELFPHCAKALMRGHLFDPEYWPRLADAPDMVTMFAARQGIEDSPALREGLKASYRADLAGD